MPPYEWRHQRLELFAQRRTSGRWAWDITIYRFDRGQYVGQVARGVEPTLTAAKPAAEAATHDWLVDQLDLVSGGGRA